MVRDKTPLFGSVEAYLPLTIKIVTKTEFEPLWDEIIREYHYLGFYKMIGQSIKYLVWSEERPVAALSFKRATLRTGVRDAFIGWNEEGRRQNLNLVVCNNRFLILPWVRVTNLASHILALSLRALRVDWKELYADEPNLVETFVDSNRFKGTCYLASNWKYLGETKGYGKRGKAFEYHGHPKKVFLYELNKDFIKSIPPHLQRTPLPDTPVKLRQRDSLTMLMGQPDYNENLAELLGITADQAKQLASRLVMFLSLFAPCFNHIAQPFHFEMIIRGLLSDLPRKSLEPIALEFGTHKDVRSLQLFSKSSPWSETKMKEIFLKLLSEFFTEEEYMATIDEVDFEKKGHESAGVARQYCGHSGKVDQCQSSVMVGIVGLHGYSLLENRMYLSKLWFGDDY
jgi:hypothetical protein